MMRDTETIQIKRRNYCFSLQKRDKYVEKLETSGNAHLHSIYNGETQKKSADSKANKNDGDFVIKQTILMLIQKVYH